MPTTSTNKTDREMSREEDMVLSVEVVDMSRGSMPQQRQPRRKTKKAKTE